MATALSPAMDTHNSEGSCRLWSFETSLAAGQKLPCLRIKSMLCFIYLLSGENITLADKKQSYNVSLLNDYGCSTLGCKLERPSSATRYVGEQRVILLGFKLPLGDDLISLQAGLLRIYLEELIFQS